MAREAVLTTDKEIKAIVKRRNHDGAKWAEIAAEYKVSEGRVMFAYMKGTLERVPTTEKTLAPTIVKLRAVPHSWGEIAVMVDQPESKVKRLFEQQSGQASLGHRIGKGGAHPGGGAVSNGSKAAGSAKKATAKTAKAATKTDKAAAKSGFLALAASGQASLEDAKKALDGFSVVVDRGKGAETIRISEVVGVKGNVITMLDADTGRNRAVKAETIQSRSARKF